MRNKVKKVFKVSEPAPSLTLAVFRVFMQVREGVVSTPSQLMPRGLS